EQLHAIFVGAAVCAVVAAVAAVICFRGADTGEVSHPGLASSL
ncbi:MAG: hypothetical protein JWP24_510, partial [Marmoricola sp.]|nr:hypothetical protein [Marmoricola sp.]